MDTTNVMMDLQEKEEYKIRKYKAEKMLVWLLTFSVIMVFAGLTSAYVIRKESKDWMSFRLPDIYFISTAVLIASSVFMIFVMNSVKQDKIRQAKIYMFFALILGVVFCFTQYQGFYGMHEQGIYALGDKANIKASFILVLTLTHVFHLVLAMLGMIWTFVKLNKGAYSSKDFHGLKLCSTFWHFMDILWVYLFLFLFFIR
jgi:cytochrome c oxidase subunit III